MTTNYNINGVCNTKIAAIVVTYNPGERFKNLIDALVGQVTNIYVVDNNSVNKDLLFYRNELSLKYILLDDNYGIARAQNVGIRAAINDSFDYILLLDHDSVPSKEMASRLLEVSQNLSASGIKVAAVGPRYFDKRQSNPPPFINFNGPFVKRMSCSKPNRIIPVSYLIASGSLISCSTFQSVGFMLDDLFIDYVDIEWGMRARLSGFQSFGVCDVFMDHDLGDVPIDFFGKKIPLHSPLRHYYLFRNAIFLYKTSAFSVSWKFGDFFRLILKFFFYSFFVESRLEHIKMMLKGISHGLINKMGRYTS